MLGGQNVLLTNFKAKSNLLKMNCLFETRLVPLPNTVKCIIFNHGFCLCLKNKSGRPKSKGLNHMLNHKSMMGKSSHF